MRFLAATAYVLLMIPIVLILAPVFAVLYFVLMVILFAEWGWQGGADQDGRKCSFVQYVRRQ